MKASAAAISSTLKEAPVVLFADEKTFSLMVARQSCYMALKVHSQHVYMIGSIYKQSSGIDSDEIRHDKLGLLGSLTRPAVWP